MRTVHPECAHAMVQLRGRPKHSTMNFTFESRNGKAQKVTNLAHLAAMLRAPGFTIVQYDKAGKALAESADPPRSKPTPLRVVKVEIDPSDEWGEIELDSDELEAKIVTSVDAESQWLKEQNESVIDTKSGPIVVKSGKSEPLMRHVFGDDWNAEMRIFELQAVARKRGLSPDKGAKKDELVTALTEYDLAHAPRPEAENE